MTIGALVLIAWLTLIGAGIGYIWYRLGDY